MASVTTWRRVVGICSEAVTLGWLRGVDLNHRPLGYEPNELPDCSTPQNDDNNHAQGRQTAARSEIDRAGTCDALRQSGRWVGFVHRTLTTRRGGFLI